MARCLGYCSVYMTRGNVPGTECGRSPSWLLSGKLGDRILTQRPPLYSGGAGFAVISIRETTKLMTAGLVTKHSIIRQEDDFFYAEPSNQLPRNRAVPYFDRTGPIQPLGPDSGWQQPGEVPKEILGPRLRNPVPYLWRSDPPQDRKERMMATRIKRRDDVNPERGEHEYGDVVFADSVNNKYPIDTPEHVRAAWSYINHADNTDKYTETEVKTIKGRIKRAAKKHGVEISGH